MSNIKEYLGLPVIGGEIFAQTDNRRDYYWYLKFVVLGPNARYNIGVSEWRSHDVPQLISKLEEALQEMVTLKNESFSGTFSKSYNATIELEAKNGSIWINFWASSNTYRFKKEICKYEDVVKIIEKLKTTKQQAEAMINNLRRIVNTKEKFFLNLGDVSVSNSYFIVNEKTYDINRILSVKMGDNKWNYLPSAFMIVFSILFLATGISIFVIIGLGIFLAACASFSKVKFEYFVILNTEFGEENALYNNNKIYITKVINALNEAIIFKD